MKVQEEVKEVKLNNNEYNEIMWLLKKEVETLWYGGNNPDSDEHFKNLIELEEKMKQFTSSLNYYGATSVSVKINK